MKKQLFYGYHFPMSVYWENYNQGGITQLSLDFSSKCNYHCDWCFNKHLLNQKEPDMLSLDERVTLLQEAQKAGAKTLVVPGTGEPTLDPYFMNTIKVAHDLGFITVVYSNLTGKVNLELLKFMHEHDVSVGIKLDSLSRQHFEERYHTSFRKFEEFRNNLALILGEYADSSEIKVAHGTAHRLVANMVLTQENKHEIGEISRFCQENGLPLFVRPVKPVMWAKRETELWKTIGNTSGVMDPGDELVTMAREHNTLFSPSSTEENHCAIFSFGLTVKQNGDVQLCPDHHDSRGMFNIRTTPLREIIRQITPLRKVEAGYCIMLPQMKH